MRTVNDVIKYVNDIKPNAFTDDTLTEWLSECEGSIQTEILCIASGDVVTYNYADNKDTELIVKPPHDKLYGFYLLAMIDFAHGEYKKYENTMQLFNAALSEFAKWFVRTHSKEAKNPEGYYMSGYDLAVKHGYSGTEEEWLKTLIGPQGVQGIQGEKGDRGIPGKIQSVTSGDNGKILVDGESVVVYDDSEIKEEIGGKVDKVQGKGLSSNDYTAKEKTKLSELPTKTELDTDLSGKEDSANKTPVLDSNSDDNQYPSAKCVYDELVKKANATDLGLQCVNLGYFEKIADFERLNIVDDCYGYFTVKGQTWIDGSYNLSVTGDFTNEKESHNVTLVGSSCTVFFLVVSEHQPPFSDETADYGHQVFYDGSYVYERNISKNTTDGTTTFTYSNPAKNSFYGYERLTNKVTGIYSDSTDEQYPSAKAVYTALLKKVNTADLGLQCTDFGYFDSYSKFYKLDPGSQITSNRYGYFSTNKNIWLGALSNAKENGNFKTSNEIPSDSSNDKDITIFFVTRKGNTITNEQGNSETTFYQSFWDDCNNIYHRTIVSEEIVHENQGGNLSIGGSSGGSTITWYEYNYTYKPLTESQINDIGKKADKTTITTSTETTANITLVDNTETRFAEITSLTVVLPETISDSFVSSAVFKSGATTTAVTVPSDIYCQGADCKNGAFLPKANKRYTMIFSYDGIMNCYISAVPIQTVATQSADDFPAANDESVAETTESVAEEPESEPNEVI